MAAAPAAPDEVVSRKRVWKEEEEGETEFSTRTAYTSIKFPAAAFARLTRSQGSSWPAAWRVRRVACGRKQRWQAAGGGRKLACNLAAIIAACQCQESSRAACETGTATAFTHINKLRLMTTTTAKAKTTRTRTATTTATTTASQGLE